MAVRMKNIPPRSGKIKKYVDSDVIFLLWLPTNPRIPHMFYTVQLVELSQPLVLSVLNQYP